MGQESTSLPRLTSFSTRNAPRGDEVDYWRQVRREAYVSVRTDPVGAGFGGEIRLGQYADFRLSTKRARAEEVRRSRSDIAQAHDEQDYLYFLFQTRGTLLVEQAGRAALASPGSLVIYDSASPFALRARDYYEQVVLELPADDAFARNRILLRASRSSEDSSRVLPGRAPSSTSAWRIQFVRHDSEIPKSFAIAESLWPGSRFLATRTTSSRNSWG